MNYPWIDPWIIIAEWLNEHRLYINEEFMWWTRQIKVGRWFARLFTPLSDGEGLGVGPFLHKYTEMKLRRERHQITIWKHGFQAAKPRVSGRETKGFRVWNPWFCKWEVSTFKSERKEDENRGDCYYFNKCFVKTCKTNKIKKCLKWGSFCINIQNQLYIYAKTSFYEHKGK